MDNYEINILRRDGNWKKVKSDDLTIDNIEKNEEEEKNKTENKKVVKSNYNFLYYLNEVNSIVSKLEILESQKSKLKSQLKNYENAIINKKKNTEDQINAMLKDKEMFDKTINLIKSLKNL